MSQHPSNCAIQREWVPVSITTRCRRSLWKTSNIARRRRLHRLLLTISWPIVRTQYALLRSPRSMPITNVLASRSASPSSATSSSPPSSPRVCSLLFLSCYPFSCRFLSSAPLECVSTGEHNAPGWEPAFSPYLGELCVDAFELHWRRASFLQARVCPERLIDHTLSNFISSAPNPLPQNHLPSFPAATGRARTLDQPKPRATVKSRRVV